MDGHCYFKKKKNQKIILNHKQPASFQFPRRLLNDEGNISACFFFFFFISTPIQKVFISALFFFPKCDPMKQWIYRGYTPTKTTHKVSTSHCPSLPKKNILKKHCKYDYSKNQTKQHQQKKNYNNKKRKSSWLFPPPPPLLTKCILCRDMGWWPSQHMPSHKH